MARRKKSRCCEDEMENTSRLEKIVESLAQSMANMQTSISNLAVTIENQNDSRPKGEVIVNKHYISLWRDLGGGNVFFCPGGSLHPVQFLDKIERLFRDAGVPDEAKVGLAINCLRQSAADWALNKEKNLASYDDFKRAFRERYWNAEHERALYYDIKYGEYTGGSRGDYLLKIAGSASYLSNSIDEGDLVTMIVDHFPTEIKRGVILNGIKRLDDLAKYLRVLDGSYEDERRRGGPRGNLRTPPVRNLGNQSNLQREGGGNHNREIRYLTSFNAEPEALLSESEEESKEENFKSPVFSGVISGQLVDILIDSGSQISAVSEEFVSQLKDKEIQVPSLPISDMSVSAAVGGKKYRVKEQVLLSVTVESDGDNTQQFTFSNICVVVPKLNTPVLFGSDWLVASQVNLDFHKMVLSLPGAGFEIKIKFETKRDGVLALNFIAGQNAKRHTYTDSEFQQAVSKAENLNEVEKSSLYTLLKKYDVVFSETPGLIKGFEHTIKMKDKTPFFKRSYPIPVAYRNEVERQVKEMVAWNVIEPAQTEFVSPLVVVKKRDGSARICLDARMLNKRMENDHVLPPKPEELLMKFRKGQVLSTLDLTASYWQIEIKEDDRKFTGFLYDNETYVFKVLPFGLSTSVASLIKAVKEILGPQSEGFVSAYVDDLLINSDNFEEHLKHLEFVLQKLKERNVTVKLRKCMFVRSEVPYLGHIISGEGVRMDPDRIRAIQEFPTPRNIRDLRGFLGLVNFERRFSSGFADLTVPLLRLLRKGVRWEWQSAEQAAFDLIKETYLKVTMVVHPDFSKTFYVQGDSSGFDVGSCLFQWNGSENRNVIAYASRTLKGAELNYTVTEKEALSIVFALQQWRCIVLGQDLVVLSDHKSLSFLMDAKLKTARLTRWTMFLQEFNFRIEYCPGKDNKVADSLSRNPLPRITCSLPDTKNSVHVALMKIVKEYRLVKENLCQIGQDQLEDEGLRKIIGVLKGEKIKGFNEEKVKRIINWFKIHDGLLFRRGTEDSPGYKLCVPRNQVLDLVKQQHAEIGHFGVKKTIAFVQRAFYWAKMSKQIRKVVLSCDLCQKSKICKRLVGKNHTIVTDRPGRLVFLDLMGPLPKSRGGVVYILAVIDGFSRYVKLYAIKKANARAIVNHLKNDYFIRVGVPERIISDNATQFHSKIWKKELESYNIQVCHTSVYFPEGNVTERVNREIGRLLRALCHEKHTKWSMYLSQIEDCLNNVVHESTGFSPSLLHFGTETPSHISDLFQFPVSDVSKPELQQRWVLAYEKLSVKAKRNDSKNDGKMSAFEVSDAVLVRQHPISSAIDATIKKFFLLYEGPYFVSKIIAPNCYELVDKEGTSIGRHNIKNLKKYVSHTRL
ncbi:unnamed protein product [Callosobruchus maculatus]|uniref:RNA-directed DNA polymerase n=1 Tax=Callosobruchus maculatus TaxID=64391 RepID=A0A653CZF1_CALMS|nr:unnamed protein product [Callosobruchus maculatus]